MKQYSIAMGIRMVCIIGLFFVHGWWLLVLVIGAIVLPYIAVVLANNSKRESSDPYQRPAGVIVLRDPQAPTTGPATGPGAFPDTYPGPEQGEPRP